MALSSFSLWEEPLQGELGMGFSFFSFPMLLVRLETSPQLLGSTCTSLREGGCLCIDMGWLEQPIPQKHQLGRGTPVDPWLQGGKEKGPGTWSTWELLWEDTEQPDPLGMSWIDPCRAGILPSASGCSSPSKHGEDPRKTQSWKPLLTATTPNRSCCRRLRLRRSGSCSLPPEWFIAGLFSPPHLIADTTEAFSYVL